MGDAVIDEQTFSYDEQTNITSTNSCDCNQCFQYDGNNRLTSYNGYPISYDMDGNMLNTVVNERNIALAFDSANRLIKADGTEYAYTAEDVRIKAVTGDKVTTYTYNTNCRLSQLLTKTTNGVVTKYVYGLGLIGEETDNSFKTYHFDYRGSTTAITDENGNITDTFKYDTYGNIIEHTGTSDTPFLFNGCDGVMTEQSGLIYMRARYYNPEIKRFINADILAGTIDNLPSLNRYAYAEGNPVSNVDPTGLSADDKGVVSNEQYINDYMSKTNNPLYLLINALGLNLSKEYDNQVVPLVNVLGGQIKVNLSISVSHQINPNGNIAVENTASGYINQSSGFDLFSSDDFSVSVGAYTDSERLAVGTYTSAQINEWELSRKKQIGVYSTASTWEMSFVPENILLPTVTVALDTEIGHLITASAIVVAVAAPYVVPAIAAAISTLPASTVATVTTFVTTAMSFMGQLSQSAT